MASDTGYVSLFDGETAALISTFPGESDRPSYLRFGMF